MKSLMKNKKAEEGGMTGKQIATVIILIASFVIILMIWRAFSFESNTVKDVCKNSIVLRSSSTLFKLQFKDITPLKCYEEKICMSSGGSCDGMVSSENSPVRTINIKTKAELLDALAQLLYVDFQTIGEGKLNPMPREAFSKRYCLFTSRINLDDKLKSDVNLRFTNAELLTKLQEKKLDNGRSYLQAIYGVNSVEQYVAYNGADKDKVRQYINDIVDFSKNDYIIATDWDSKGYVGSIVAGAGAVAAVAALIWAAPVTIPASIATVAVLGSGATAGYYTLPDPDDPKKTINGMFLPPSLVPNTQEYLATLDCDYIESLP